MRVGVIRGDLPGPVSLMDLEPVSQYNPPTEPRGQEVRLGRPVLADVEALVALHPAGLQGATDISGGDTVDGTNDTLRLRLDSGDAFTDIAIANAVYADGQEIADAVNAALIAEPFDARVRLDDTGTLLILYSVATGTDSYIETDSTAGGNTFNGVAGFNVAGESFTVQSAAAIITDLNPVGGPIDVTSATFDTSLGFGPTTAQRTALADVLAPRFIETDVAIKSFQVGMISGFRSANYNPDPNRIPAIADGAAISVVSDDGTAFTAPLTVITAATTDDPGAGDLTIDGTNLGNPEVEATVVKAISANGQTSVKLYQSQIVAAGGSVTAIEIVIPASLMSGIGEDGTVQVQYTSFASDVETIVT